MNPLLENSKLAFEAIDFTKIKDEHYLPALEAAIKDAKEKLSVIKTVTETTFENVILAEENSADKLDQVVEVFYALHSAHCTDGLTEIAEEFNQKLTEYNSDISLDAELFHKVKEVYDKRETLGLNIEQMTLVENSYKGYSRNGALLNESDKNTLREIDQNMSKLSLDYSENVRKANIAYTLFVDNDKDLKGIPEGAVEAAKETASEKGEPSKWAFTFDYPSYLPFIQHCQNRSLRKELWSANVTKNIQGEFDNSQNIKEILKARKQRAMLLGYKDHPSFVLERRMAKSSDTVMNFIEEIKEKAFSKAVEEMNSLKAIKKELSGDDDFRKYDSAMYQELLKKKELDFDDEVLRPYFKLENVINGVFTIANKLYGLNFKKRDDIPKYHEDVVIYEVTDDNNEFVGLYYGDFFPRAEKRPGAWMTTFRNAGYQFGEVKRPFVCNVCNFTKPTSTKPSLLTLNEVYTLFHEFGHGLHGLLAKSTYKTVAGTNVFWDFVELPSQIMENWVTEKECLDLFAKHYETGESIPQDLVAKIKKNEKFLSATGTLRQMSFANLDMQWHLAEPNSIGDIREFETNALKGLDLFPDEGIGAMSPSFSHIFSGGYSSGYYSYKWAEVLDADAFAYFKEKGIFNKEVATSFKENILERGGSEDPMELYKRFRGQEPTPDALLKRGGLL
jgi:peptidyl-dipeptidase Dcp